MKVIEVNGVLELEGDALEGAEEAFRNRRYVEAFALLHAYIDWWMTANIQLRNNFEFKPRFMPSANYLRTHKIINDEQYERLRKFNELRDMIIHRIVRYSYQHMQITYKIKNKEVTERSKVRIFEVDEGFKEGKDLAQLLKEKTSLPERRSHPEVINGEKPDEKP
jgi:hypothetical protein